MNILVTYDVSTETKEGRARLRRVAKVCESWGQRVQYSVFECSVNETQLEQMKQRLLRVINVEEDSLRIYRLPGKREALVHSWGRDRYIDFESPLVA